MIYDLKRPVDLRLFDYRCYIHLRRSCFLKYSSRNRSKRISEISENILWRSARISGQPWSVNGKLSFSNNLQANHYKIIIASKIVHSLMFRSNPDLSTESCLPPTISKGDSPCQLFPPTLWRTNITSKRTCEMSNDLPRYIWNIVRGTTDPRVKFCLQNISSKILQNTS